MSIWGNYPYLCMTAAGALATTIMVVLSRKQGKMILLSASAGLPPAVFAPAFEGCYWNPKRLLGGGIGIEDFLCGFMVAGVLWWGICRVPRFRNRDADPGRFWKRYLVISAPAITASYAAYFADMDGLTLALIGPLIVILLLAYLDLSLWRYSVAGLVIFLVFWWANLKLHFLLWPQFPGEWNQAVWFGRTFAGVPLGELIWAAAFGLCWPALMAWCMGVTFTRAGRAGGLDPARRTCRGSLAAAGPCANRHPSQ